MDLTLLALSSVVVRNADMTSLIQNYLRNKLMKL